MMAMWGARGRVCAKDQGVFAPFARLASSRRRRSPSLSRRGAAKDAAEIVVAPIVIELGINRAHYESIVRDLQEAGHRASLHEPEE